MPMTKPQAQDLLDTYQVDLDVLQASEAMQQHFQGTVKAIIPALLANLSLIAHPEAATEDNTVEMAQAELAKLVKPKSPSRKGHTPATNLEFLQKNFNAHFAIRLQNDIKTKLATSPAAAEAMNTLFTNPTEEEIASAAAKKVTPPTSPKPVERESVDTASADPLATDEDKAEKVANDSLDIDWSFYLKCGAFAVGLAAGVVMCAVAVVTIRPLLFVAGATVLGLTLGLFAMNSRNDAQAKETTEEKAADEATSDATSVASSN